MLVLNYLFVANLQPCSFTKVTKYNFFGCITCEKFRIKLSQLKQKIWTCKEYID